MNKLFLYILLLLFPVLTFGQELSVGMFYLSEKDMTANLPGTMVKDQNGNVCALIKVETTLDGFSFDVGSLGVSDVKRVGGEIWLYVPHGIRKITISHPQLSVLRDYPIPCSIDKGRTYIMKLNTSLGNHVYNSEKQQKMILQVSPSSAKVEVNGIRMPVDRNGICEQEMSFGIYDVLVSAPKYHSSRMQIEINDELKAQHFNVNLKQAFGWLNIVGDGDEKLSIDGRPYTFISNKNLELDSGHYKILIEKPYYKPYEAVVEIKDSTVYRLDPKYVVNYSEVEFKVFNEAEIWIDDVKVGSGQWKGKLEYGPHRIECRKESHRTTERIMNVEPLTRGLHILEAPEPIYGTLIVSSAPFGAEVYVDDVLVGRTPATLRTLIGSREVCVKREGFDNEFRTVLVRESETARVDVTMKDIIAVTITSSPYADLYVDGKYVGDTPWSNTLTVGDYNVKLRSRNYYDFEKKVKFDGATKDYHFKMRRRFFKRNSLYLAGQYQLMGGMTGYGAAVGGYLNNINAEVNMTASPKASEVIYWNVLEEMTLPSGYAYKPLYIGAKVGYGCVIAGRLRFTPQVGCGVLSVTGARVIEGESDPLATNGYCIPVVGGARLDIAVVPVVSVCAGVDYSHSIVESELYKQLSAVSKTIQGYSSGLSVSAGLCFTF